MRVVVQRLQQEADSVVRGLVEGWEDERRVGRLASPIIRIFLALQS